MKKRNNKFINRIKKLLAIFIIAILLFYLITTLYSLIQQPNNISIVENGKLYLEEETQGIIIREETVIKGNNYENGMLQIKTEGQKVAKGDSVFRYYSLQENSVKQEISEIEAKIQELMPNSSEAESSDVALIENQIKTELQELYKINDLQKIQEYKSDIDMYMARKIEIMAQDSKDKEINKLIAQKQKYENDLSKNYEYVNAPVSGVVSYRVYNLEDVLDSRNFSYLNENTFSEINIKPGQIIATSEESGKIINNFEGYIAVMLDSSAAKTARIGNKVELQLSTSKKIKAEIVYISKTETGKRIIVFKITNNIEELVKYRKISLNIIWWEYSGFKVPNDAIITEENGTYIIRNRTGYTDKILVKLEKQNQNYSIISNYSTDELEKLGYTKTEINKMKKLELYDEIIVFKK